MKGEAQMLTVRLKPRVRRPVLLPEAWLLPGSSPQEWLDLLAESADCLDVCEGFVLPRSLQDPSPSGFLVVNGLGAKAPSAWSQGYRRMGERLWLPCDADLCPEMRGVEADDLLRQHHAAVWHPRIGLVGFEEADGLSVADLLGGLKERASNFSWAHPGMPLQDRLYGITAQAVPKIDLVLGDIGQEIGNQLAEGLPETPEEASERGLRPLGKQVSRRVLDALKKLSSKSNEKGSRWRERLEAWTDQRLEALRKDQDRELSRLLHLLKSNPDEGLKYALPLTGNAPGENAPSDPKLSERTVDFKLGGLGNRQPGSPWVVDWQKHYELSRQYREAANRELRLGRHRRAAYIYAELLKDYREAANVLRQGKHYREASVLYLKHLGDPLEGARCLREGGFPLEAIPIFESKKQHEAAAELYLELGNEAEAMRQYRFAVSRALAHGHTVKAATLLEEHMDGYEEAIALLQKSWPRADDAVTCLDHELGLYEREGASRSLVTRMEEVTADHPPARAVGLMESLLRVARRSQVPEARTSAEHCAFTVAGRWLGAPTFSETRTMLGLVRRLVPEDRLLARDTARFLQQNEEAAKQRLAKLARVSDDGAVVMLETHQIPSWVSWNTLEPSARSGVYGLGVAAQGLTLMRLHWDGAYQTQMMPNAIVGKSSGHCRLTVTEGALPEVVSILGMKQLPPTVLPPADAFATEVRVENPPWVDESDFLSLTYGGNGVAWVLQRDQREEGLVVVSSFSAMGDLIATHTLSLPVGALSEEVRGPIPMIWAKEQLIFAYGRHLVRYYRDRVESLEMAEAPNRLHFAPLGRLQMAASYDVGAEIFWGDGHWGRSAALDLPVNDPYITFTRTGDVLALSRDRLDWLAYQKGRFVPMHMEDLSGFGDPLGIFPTETPNIYAMVSQREVRTFKVTPWQLGQ